MNKRVLAPKPKRSHGRVSGFYLESESMRKGKQGIRMSKTPKYDLRVDPFSIEDIESEMAKMSVTSEILGIVSRSTSSRCSFPEEPVEDIDLCSSFNGIERCHNPFSKNFLKGEEKLSLLADEKFEMEK